MVTRPKLIMTRLSGRESCRPSDAAARPRPAARAEWPALPLVRLCAGLTMRAVRVLVAMVSAPPVSASTHPSDRCAMRRRDAAPRPGSLFYSSSRTLSSRTVSAIRSRFGSPRASDFASFAACLTVTLGGIGGSNGSTTASTTTGPRVREGLLEHGAALGRVLDPEARPAARAGERDEVDRVEIAAVLRVAEEHHLLPLDLAQGVVLDHHDLDRQVVLHGGGELGHEHRESAVADEGRRTGAPDTRSAPRSRRAARWPSRRACPTASASARVARGCGGRTTS